MKYAIVLSDDNRVLSSTYEKYALENSILVDILPQGNLSDYIFIDGEYIYDPIPEEIFEEAPTQLDRIEAQITYTAMMTDTLLEV